MLILVVRLRCTRVLMAPLAGLMTLIRCKRAWTLHRLCVLPPMRGETRIAKCLPCAGSGTGLWIRVLACPVALMTLVAVRLTR